MTTTTKKIPVRALQFAADVQMDKASDGGNVPLTITARSGKPVNHWWWMAPIIHDMAGFKTKPSIPLDYCHDPKEVVGYADKFDVSSGDLVVSGALTPFKDGDRASEIIDKKPRGVPYEASIFFDPYEMTIEEVPTGVKVNVNGADYSGPLNVVRQWTLRGVAVCPYGTDSQTAVEFSNDPAAKSEVAVTILSKDPTMPNATLNGKPAGQTSFDDDPKKDDEDDKKKSEQGDDPDKKDDDKEKGEQDDEEDDKKKDDDAGKQTAPTGPGAQFLTEFGERGGVWFAQGKTIDEARALFTQHLKDENAHLKKALSDEKAKVKLSRGETKPAQFSSPPTAADQAKAEFAKKTGSPGMGAFAASLKIPGQPSSN